MMDCTHCGSQMIENHWKDRLVKEVLLMVLVMHTEEDDTVLHIEKTGRLMLVVEVDVGGMTADVVDKLNCSSDDVQPRQVDLRSAHALIELHWHDTYVDPDRHEVDQHIYATGSENRPLMLSKENYVPWSSRLLRYAKSRPNGKLIHNSIINGPYVRRMIPEPGDPIREVPVNETFHVKTYDELTKKELKQIEADDQVIQTILLGLPEDIYAAVDSCEAAQEIWLRVQQMMKGSDIGIQEKKAKNQVIQNAIQNPRIQNVRNQNGLIVVPGNANQNPNENGNLVAARAKGNATGHNDSIADCSKEEAGIQLQAEEFDLMAAVADLDEIEEVNANYILMANLQQASTSGTQTDKAPVYDPDGSAEVHNYKDFYDNEIFNMFTQEKQYTELLEPIPEPHQVPYNDNNVISEISSVEQSGGTVEQHPANVEETRVLYDSL
nr:hypothetical protein [Tanacetum cinerariifolium]